MHVDRRRFDEPLARSARDTVAPLIDPMNRRVFQHFGQIIRCAAAESDDCPLVRMIRRPANEGEAQRAVGVAPAAHSTAKRHDSMRLGAHFFDGGLKYRKPGRGRMSALGLLYAWIL